MPYTIWYNIVLICCHVVFQHCVCLYRRPWITRIPWPAWKSWTSRPEWSTRTARRPWFKYTWWSRRSWYAVTSYIFVFFSSFLVNNFNDNNWSKNFAERPHCKFGLFIGDNVTWHQPVRSIADGCSSRAVMPLLRTEWSLLLCVAYTAAETPISFR